MKIRTYSQQAAMKSIENSVLSMYKKAQLAETAGPFVPLMVEIAEKMGFSVTEDEVKEFLKEADEFLSEIGISKEMVMEKLESIKEKISEMYEKFKSYLPDMDTEEELKEQIDQAKDGFDDQSNDAFDLTKGITLWGKFLLKQKIYLIILQTEMFLVKESVWCCSFFTFCWRLLCFSS